MDHPGMDKRIIVKRILKNKVGVCVDKVDLAQCRDKWQTFLNMLMSLRIPYKVENFLTM
jgi:hypothetical protein